VILSTGLIVLGILLLLVGGEVLLRGAVGMAALLRLTPAVIGLTVVAAGTSVPELAVSGIAAYQGNSEIAVANVIGSNIFNVTVIIGLCAIVRPFNLTGNTLRLEYPVLALATLMCVAVVQDGFVGRIDALLFVATYVAFTAYLVRLVRHQVTKEEKEELKTEVEELALSTCKPSMIWCVALVTCGVILLGLGAQSTVSGASQLARLIGWSERVIGLTIVSAGTGLPEVVASLVSSIRGRSDVAIGNVIGSNLFNILIILGLSGVVTPLSVQPTIAASDCWWMLGATLALLPIMLNGFKVYRWEGILLLGTYVAYIWILLAGSSK
jgi:cation:H+ antiporter